MTFVGLAPRAKYNRSAPEPNKGVLVREAAICSDCGRNCTVGGNIEVTPGYYSFYDEKLCKVCIKRQRAI